MFEPHCVQFVILTNFEFLPPRQVDFRNHVTFVGNLLDVKICPHPFRWILKLALQMWQ